MSSSGVNVLRWSALGAGLFFGITHQRSITASNRAAAAKREYEHKLHLIQEAKVAYAKSKEPVVPGMNAIGGLNQDPNDPKFDLESYLLALAKANP